MMNRVKKHWHVYAGAGAILLFAVLLLFRLGIPEKLISSRSRAAAPPAAAVPLGETWMNITQAGQKIGYAQRTYAKTEEGFRFTENVFMRINTMGVVQPLTVRTAAELKPDRTLSTFQFDLRSNLFKFTARGAVAGRKLTVRIGGPDEERVSEIALADQPYLGGGILESVGSAGLKKGEGRSYPVFDPASLGQKPVRVIFLAEEPLTVAGNTVPARKLAVDFMGMKQTAWVDLEGNVLREEGMLGIVLSKVSREEALAGLAGAVSADLTEIAAITVDRTIADPAALKILRIRLSGVEQGEFQLDGGRQDYKKGVLTVRREDIAGGKTGAEASPKDLAAYLKAAPLIQADHPKILKKAAEIVGADGADSVKAQRILAWVNKNLEKRPVLSVPNAVETLENSVGDCNEHAVLLAALARAAGIPAEVEAGVVYMRGRFFYHAWNVLYLKDRLGWVTADAVLGQMPADVTHLRFVRGDAERQLDLAGLIGTLKLYILKME